MDGWLHNDPLVDSQRIKVSGLSAMLVKRRLQIIHELIVEYELEVNVQWIPSHANKADKGETTVAAFTCMRSITYKH